MSLASGAIFPATPAGLPTKGTTVLHLLRTVALTAGTAVVVASCGGSSGADDANAPLRIAGPFEVHSLQPAASSGLFTRLQVVETLVASDLEGQLAPGLSPAWSASRDQRSWTFDLPDAVTFHDGTALTAEAVASSLRHAAEDAASPLAEAPIRRIEKAGDDLRIRLTKPFPSLPAVLTHYSTAIHAPASYDIEGDVVEVIGTGAYRVTQATLPAQVRTARFEAFRGTAPAIEEVTFQSVPRAESRALLATSGQADIVFGLEPSGRDRVDATDGVAMVSTLQPRSLYLKVNGDHPALGDVRVRRALSLALDRETIAGAVLRERDLAATQLFPPSLPGWNDPDLAPLTEDTTEAKALLRQAGLVGDKALRITLTTYPDRPELPALATAVQAAWEAVGVEVKVDVTNSSEIPARHQDGSLDVALLARHLALVSDPLVTAVDTFARNGSDWGVMNWHDDAVTDALATLQDGADDEERLRLQSVVSSTAHEQLPVIPVAWYRMNAAVTDRLDGFVLDPLEHSWRLSDASWR